MALGFLSRINDLLESAKNSGEFPNAQTPRQSAQNTLRENGYTVENNVIDDGTSSNNSPYKTTSSYEKESNYSDTLSAVDNFNVKQEAAKQEEANTEYLPSFNDAFTEGWNTNLLTADGKKFSEKYQQYGDNIYQIFDANKGADTEDIRALYQQLSPYYAHLDNVWEDDAAWSNYLTEAQNNNVLSKVLSGESMNYLGTDAAAIEAMLGNALVEGYVPGQDFDNDGIIDPMFSYDDVMNSSDDVFNGLTNQYAQLLSIGMQDYAKNQYANGGLSDEDIAELTKHQEDLFRATSSVYGGYGPDAFDIKIVKEGDAETDGYVDPYEAGYGMMYAPVATSGWLDRTAAKHSSDVSKYKNLVQTGTIPQLVASLPSGYSIRVKDSSFDPSFLAALQSQEE